MTNKPSSENLSQGTGRSTSTEKNDPTLTDSKSDFERVEARIEKKIRKYSAAEITIFGFLAVILVGSFAVYLTENIGGQSLSVVDAVFMSTSAVCVTGLASVDFSEWSFAGQVVIMVLIQIGGFGVVTAFRLLWVGRASDLSPGSAMTLESLLDVEGGRTTLLQILASTAKLTLAFEFLGFLVMYGHLKTHLPEDVSALWFSVFHTVSAFNNAGFGLYSDSLVQFQGDKVLNLIIAAQIIVGGIGYPVLLGLERLALLIIHRAFSFTEVVVEMVAIRKPERLPFIEPVYNLIDRARIRAKSINEELAGVASPLQMKIVIYGSLFLIAAGMAFTLLFEHNDPNSLGMMTMGDKLMAAFFQSVTTRTAGFNTVDIATLQTRTLLMFILLMFIGAGPQGTAGGIKIPTFVTMLGYIRSSFRGRNRVSIYRYVVSKVSVANAVKLYVMSSTFVCAATLLMAAVESQFSLMQMTFEVVSAFGTVGLSTGITTYLSAASKILLVLTMFTGRVGLLTIGSAIIKPLREAAPTGAWKDDGMKLQIG